ncbi:asparagine synthase-related protein [Streptomyces sp. NPDC048157]|uniref:asparagine synthase-related protein n=1 Tax=Streptomyces sp. NPDC048157 TaxID=3365503 RepID=UPI0037161C6F
MSWFVVVPDEELPRSLLARLRERASNVVSYPSGRPWLLGSWRPEQMARAQAGERLLAVAGTSSATAAGLTARLKGVRTVADLEEALRGLAGSFHVAACLDGYGYVRGSASGARRLYRSRVEGVTVCADRARTLAWLTGAELDTAQLAARLTASYLPHPLAGDAMWTGVDSIRPGDALHLRPDGTSSAAAWWQPPPAEMPLAEGAGHLREALRAAVALRVRARRTLAADLSGGMDSTSLCFLAAEAGASLVTATLHWNTPGNQDHHYAQYAADRLPGITALRFTSAQLPTCFTGLDQRHEPLEEPAAVLRDRARQQHVARALRERGAVLRLSGHGGDHAVIPPASYLHALARRSPHTALRQLAGFKARDRWTMKDSARMLLSTPDYPAWLAGTARRTQTADSAQKPELWGARPVLPIWASAQAREQFAALLDTAATHAQPLAHDPGRHAWIQQMREAGRVAGLLNDAGAVDGLAIDSPFCDDTVQDACLAVRPQEAGHPWSYKPLLAAAMETLVPAPLLHRTTKDHCGPDWHHGLKTHRRPLAHWADTSHLVAAGLADEALLRRALLSPGLNAGGAPALENTLGTEEWLRDLTHHPTPHYLAHHPARERSVDTAAH